MKHHLVGRRVGIPHRYLGWILTGRIINQRTEHGTDIFLVKRDKTGRESWQLRGYFSVIDEVSVS